MGQVKDNGISSKKLLVARSDKGYGKRYRRLQLIPKDEEIYRIFSRETYNKWSSGKTIDILDVKVITKLLLVAEKDAILVMCNRLSKITHF